MCCFMDEIYRKRLVLQKMGRRMVVVGENDEDEGGT